MLIKIDNQWINPESVMAIQQGYDDHSGRRLTSSLVWLKGGVSITLRMPADDIAKALKPPRRQHLGPM